MRGINSRGYASSSTLKGFGFYKRDSQAGKTNEVNVSTEILSGGERVVRWESDQQLPSQRKRGSEDEGLVKGVRKVLCRGGNI